MHILSSNGIAFKGWQTEMHRKCSGDKGTEKLIFLLRHEGGGCVVNDQE